MDAQMEDPRLVAARKAKAAMLETLKDDPDLNGVGIGGRGEQYVVRVYLLKDRPDLTARYKEVEKHPVDFIVTGPIVAGTAILPEMSNFRNC